MKDNFNTIFAVWYFLAVVGLVEWALKNPLTWNQLFSVAVGFTVFNTLQVIEKSRRNK